MTIKEIADKLADAYVSHLGPSADADRRAIWFGALLGAAAERHGIDEAIKAIRSTPAPPPG